MHSKNSRTSIIICDDHPIFRQGLLRIIERDESLKLIGECGDGNSAFDLIKNQKPDIAILDITMPGKTGLAVAHLVRKEHLPTKIIIITMHKDEEYLNEAIEIGVQGYLLKENAVTDLAVCIQKVISGKYFVSPLLEDILVSYTKNSLAESNYLFDIDKLTELERKVLKLIANNKTSSEILAELSLTPETLQKCREQIIEKLDLYGPYKLYEFALQHKESF